MDPRELRLPDRFESLSDSGDEQLQVIITPVEETLRLLDDRFLDMQAAGRGGFMIFRGPSGAGKSTFLNTVGLFREQVTTVRLRRGRDIVTDLAALPATNAPRIVVLEGREALGKVSQPELEAAMHEVNQFVRTEEGRRTLVVWPTNKDDLTDLLVDLARDLGDETLLDLDEPVTRFTGPAKEDFVGIAERTVAALNDGVSLSGLGISEQLADELAASATTIGSYLTRVRKAAIAAGDQVQGLLVRERYRMWTLVIAGTDVEGDVAALTRGGHSFADVDRLMSATGANVVKDLKEQPDQIGILGTVLDARIFHLDMLTALAVAREFGSKALHDEMKQRGMDVSRDRQAIDRLKSSDLGSVLAGNSMGTRKRGPKAGDNTKEAFAKLADIARQKDGLLNDAVGRGLAAAGLVTDVETEKSLGTELAFMSDLFCIQGGAPLRLEMMWRAKAGRAHVANYVLGKINNYGRAIGLLR
jgi:DNA (cytosine-5)-methyltransferase 1